MAGTQPTLTNNGPIPAVFTSIGQSLQANAALAQASAVQQNSVVLDQFSNACLIIGNLNQVVTIGAGWIAGSPVVGVEVGTGLTGFGLAYPSAFAQTTITLTAGSTAATVASSSGFVNGMQIGATLYEVPPSLSATQPPNYIQPGTTMTFSGTSVTLSQNALLSGSGLYCAVVAWTALSTTVHP